MTSSGGSGNCVGGAVGDSNAVWDGPSGAFRLAGRRPIETKVRAQKPQLVPIGDLATWSAVGGNTSARLATRSMAFELWLRLHSASQQRNAPCDLTIEKSEQEWFWSLLGRFPVGPSREVDQSHQRGHRMRTFTIVTPKERKKRCEIVSGSLPVLLFVL